MRKILLLTIGLAVLFSCNSTRTVTYKAISVYDSVAHYKKFYIDVPKNGKLKKEKDYTGDFHTEYRIIYPDSSVVYITNDTWNGSRLNYENLMQIGVDSYSKEHLYDTLKYEGVQNDGLYWKDYVLGEIVVGYVNCPKRKKNEYDNVINTLRSEK